MFRVIIAGGRDFDDYEFLARTMDFYLGQIEDEIVVLCALCPGADALGQQYAKERGYRLSYHPANWEYYGKTAGSVRNREMAQNADALAAFWDGQSPGTRDMIEQARKYNLLVRIKRYKNRKAV